MTADRLAHYQQVSGGGEEIQRMFQDIEPAHPFALSLQGLFPHMTLAPVQHASLTALAADDIALGHQQVHCTPLTDQHMLCSQCIAPGAPHEV